MERKLKVAFAWQGVSDPRIFNQWNDGLRGAMKIIEKVHNVRYYEPSEEITDADIILYWEAPCTYAGKDRLNYYKIQSNPIKKAMLFAGGPIKREWCGGFDLFFVESAINEKEFDEIGLPWKRAFGVNTDIYKPEKQPKIFDAVFQATCASWKRHGLFSRALKSKGAVCGRFQPEDPIGFLNCRENGTLVLPELTAQGVTALINSAHTVVNTSSYWGGGQRTTLEAMACGVPVIVMSDSPKNMEYVQECDGGLVVDPDEGRIQWAIEETKKWSEKEKARGLEYVRSKWTHEHYAQNLLEGIKSII